MLAEENIVRVVANVDGGLRSFDWDREFLAREARTEGHWACSEVQCGRQKGQVGRVGEWSGRPSGWCPEVKDRSQGQREELAAKDGEWAGRRVVWKRPGLGMLRCRLR